ncbi:hypothetical protein LAX5112_04489 [Roseibium alexandrii]|uniref:Uncharacterized protein n=1 Tax=Roseibium alexandrii TaxID=388408 RepID=A0A0M7ANP7_9HYPH|nr:hypothetical protein LAX5112_04489 [Roseibium alexandrii]
MRGLAAARSDLKPKSGSDGQYAEDPGPGFPHRAADTTNHREGVVERSDCLTGGDEPGNIPPDQQPAKGNDKGRDSKIADHPALETADNHTGDNTAKDGQHPDYRVSEPHELRQDIRLDHCHHGRHGGEHRADRQVDMACDDDEDHACCHDRNGYGLDRQVEDVARGQEPAFGEHIEHQAQDNERANHTQKARIQLQRGKEVSCRLALRAGQCRIGHCGYSCLETICFFKSRVANP